MSDDIPAGVERQLDMEAPIPPVDQGAPVYRVDAATKIAVSKHYGKLWKGRIGAAEKSRQTHRDAWDEAIRYYNNAQTEHRETGDNRSGNRYFSKRRNT